MASTTVTPVDFYRYLRKGCIDSFCDGKKQGINFLERISYVYRSDCTWCRKAAFTCALAGGALTLAVLLLLIFEESYIFPIPRRADFVIGIVFFGGILLLALGAWASRECWKKIL